MVKWDGGFAAVGGERFYYLRSVARSGIFLRPLVLLHGASDNGDCWTPAAGHWTATYDVILPDNRGHGRSPRVSPEQSVDVVADHVAVLQALRLHGIALGGHSMGAETAANLAVQQPELVSALVLEDPPWRVQPQDPETARQWVQRTLRWRDMTIEQRIATQKSYYPRWSDEELRVWAPAKGEYDYNYLTAHHPTLDWRETASRLHCPGLLVTGDTADGAMVTPEVAAYVAQVWPQVQVVRIAGAGHNIRREQPRAYFQALDTFLAQHYPAA
jgi:N-formylmaleamate deformylase